MYRDEKSTIATLHTREKGFESEEVAFQRSNNELVHNGIDPKLPTRTKFKRCGSSVEVSGFGSREERFAKVSERGRDEGLQRLVNCNPRLPIENTSTIRDSFRFETFHEITGNSLATEVSTFDSSSTLNDRSVYEIKSRHAGKSGATSTLLVLTTLTLPSSIVYRTSNIQPAPENVPQGNKFTKSQCTV